MRDLMPALRTENRGMKKKKIERERERINWKNKWKYWTFKWFQSTNVTILD